MLGPFATTSRLTPIHQMSLAVLATTATAGHVFSIFQFVGLRIDVHDIDIDNDDDDNV